MKFILNTSLDPHFCAVFSEENKLIDKLVWTERSKDGINVYNFLYKHNSANFSFCGGISGPGGFASLRAASSILTSISISNDIDINQISAEKFIFKLIGHEDFLLNSFGDSVWMSIDGEISRKLLSDVDLKKSWFVDFLPDKKKEKFVLTLDCKINNIELKLLESLIEVVSKKTFIPHYEVAPV